MNDPALSASAAAFIRAMQRSQIIQLNAPPFQTYKTAMNKIASLAVLGAFLVPVTLVSSQPAQAKPARKTAKKAPQVNWQPSYWAAQKAAKRSGKPLFIDFYTDWCGPCKYLDQTTYRDAQFVAYSRGWVMVKVNPEKSEFGRKLAEKYRVRGFPAMIFTDGRGTKHGEAVGAYPTQMLIPAMKRAAKKAGGTSV